MGAAVDPTRDTMSSQKVAIVGANNANTQKEKNPKGGVEGEGSYTATHRYNEGLEKSVKEGRTEQLAKEAKKALNESEGEELREAEARAKKEAAAPVQKKH